MQRTTFLFLIAAIGVGCGTVEKATQETETTTSANSIQLTAEQIKTAGIEVGKLQRRSLDALLHVVGVVAVSPMQRTAVHSTVTGYLRKINLQVGTRVQKGDVLAVLEHPSYIERQRELLETQARLPFLEAEAQRKKELQVADAGSLKNYQAAQAEYDWARAHLEGLKAELSLMGFAVDKILAEGKYQQQLTITAPVSGVVTALNANPGKLVVPDVMLCEVSDLSQLHADLQVFAQQMAQIQEGQKVTIRLSGSGRTYPAVISRIVPQVGDADKTALVRATFEGATAGLMAGMPLQADVHLSARQSWVIGKENLLESGDKTFAFGVRGNEIHLVPVAVQGAEAEWVAVETDTAQQFVVKGGYYLQDRF